MSCSYLNNINIFESIKTLAYTIESSNKKKTLFPWKLKERKPTEIQRKNTRTWRQRGVGNMCNEEKSANRQDNGNCVTHKHEKNSEWFRIYVMWIELVWHKSKFTAITIKKDEARKRERERIQNHAMEDSKDWKTYSFMFWIYSQREHKYSRRALLFFVRFVVLPPPEWRQFFRKHFQMLFTVFILAVVFATTNASATEVSAIALATENSFICNEIQCQ